MLPIATDTKTLFSLPVFKQWLGVTSNKTKTISSLTSVGLVATAVCAAHGYSSNTCVVIAGASPNGYSGETLLTVVDANTFTYPLAATLSSPATGTPTVTIDDGRLAAIADAASAEFEGELGVPFVQRSVSFRFDGTGKTAHALPIAPIASITSFTIGGAAVDASTYVLDSDSGVITFTSGAFTLGTKNVALTVVAGYDVQDGAALPRDVYRASLDLAKAIHDELVSNAIAASTVSLGPASMVIKPSDRPASVQRVFKLWDGKAYRA